MNLVAWRAGRKWSGYHIEKDGLLACGMVFPTSVTGVSRTAAKPESWGQVCVSCRGAVLRGTPQAVEETDDAA